MTKSDQTREFIIEKSAPIFNQKGYVGTSLTDMTEATKLTKGSIYGNFANKDEVALAAFDYNLNKAQAIISQEMAKYSTAKEKLLVYGKIYTNFADYNFPVGGCPILNTAIESDDTHPELRKRTVDAINSWKKKLMNILEKGIERNEFRKDLETEQIALTMISMIEGGSMIAKVTGSQKYRTAIMKSLEEFIERID